MSFGRNQPELSPGPRPPKPQGTVAKTDWTLGRKTRMKAVPGTPELQVCPAPTQGPGMCAQWGRGSGFTARFLLGLRVPTWTFLPGSEQRSSWPRTRGDRVQPWGCCPAWWTPAGLLPSLLPPQDHSRHPTMTRENLSRFSRPFSRPVLTCRRSPAAPRRLNPTRSVVVYLWFLLRVAGFDVVEFWRGRARLRS